MRRPVLVLALLAFLSCDARETLVQPDSPEIPPPALEIFDDSDLEGTPGFHWLPPIVLGPSASTGELDVELLPFLSVEICEWSGTVCLGDLIQEFTSEETKDGWVQIIEKDGKPPFFQVNWDASKDGVDASKIHRIRVMAGPVELGFADVDAVAKMKDAKDVDQNEFVALVEKRTLPIKFVVLEGALEGAGGAVVGSEGGVLERPD